MAELDGYLRAPGGGAPGAAVFAPPSRPGSAAAGLAWSAFFPAGVWLGDGIAANQAARWGTTAGSAVQGADFSVTVMPGREYTASVYVYPLTPTTHEIAIDGAAPGTSTALPLAWTRLSVTFTATQPTHAVTVQTSGSVIPGGVYTDDVQVEEGAAASAFTATGSVVYNIFRDFVERWPSSWKYRGYVGLAEITCVDAFAALQSADMNTEYVMALLSLFPDYYWQLNDPSGSVSFGEGAGTGGSPLVRLDSKFGPATTYAPGTTTNIVGDPGGVGVAISSPTAPAPTASSLQTGVTVTAPTVTIGSASLPTTVTCAIWAVHTPPNAQHQPMRLWNIRGNTLFAGLFNDAGTGKITWGNLTDTAGTGASVTDTWDDGIIHLYVGITTITGSDRTDTLWIDGVQVATHTAAGTYVSTASTVQVGASNGPYGILSGFNGGVYAHLAVWNRALSSTEIGLLWTAGDTGFSGEASGTRVARYLSYIYTGSAVIAPGLSIMGPATVTGGDKGLAAIQNVTTSENGNFWVNASGEPDFTDRNSRYLELTSSVTFGEDTDGGEIPYAEDVQFSVDPTLVYNDVRVTQSGGGVAVGGNQALIYVSQRLNFVRSYTRTIDVLSVNEVQDAADYLFNQHWLARQRVESVTIDPASWPDAWPTVLGLEIGDRVTVLRRPKAANSGAGFTMRGDFFVEQISHDNIDMQAGTWSTTLLLSPVDQAQVGIFDNDTYGRLATGAAEIHTAITATDTQVAVDFLSGGDVFTLTEIPFTAAISDELVLVTAVVSAASDGFNRTVSNGWGSADVGGAWSTSGGVAGDYAVAPSLGSQTMSTTNARRETFLAVDYSYVEAVFTMRVSAVATGAMITGAWTCRRTDGNNEYRFEVNFQTDSTINLRIRSIVAGSATTLGSVTGVFSTYTSATVLHIRCQATDSTLRMRAWTGSFEPTYLWQVSVTDSSWATGGVGFLSLANTGCTNVNPAVSFGAFTLPSPQTITFERAAEGTAAPHDAGIAIEVSPSFVFAY